MHQVFIIFADMVSVETLLIAGGVMTLVIGGVFFATAALITGFIKRRRNQTMEMQNRASGPQHDNSSSADN